MSSKKKKTTASLQGLIQVDKTKDYKWQREIRFEKNYSGSFKIGSKKKKEEIYFFIEKQKEKKMLGSILFFCGEEGGDREWGEQKER